MENFLKLSLYWSLDLTRRLHWSILCSPTWCCGKQLLLTGLLLLPSKCKKWYQSFSASIDQLGVLIKVKKNEGHWMLATVLVSLHHGESQRLPFHMEWCCWLLPKDVGVRWSQWNGSSVLCNSAMLGLILVHATATSTSTWLSSTLFFVPNLCKTQGWIPVRWTHVIPPDDEEEEEWLVTSWDADVRMPDLEVEVKLEVER